ncbi:MAG: hypothetical protein Q9213_001798 [Squamulea squamosa]
MRFIFLIFSLTSLLSLTTAGPVVTIHNTKTRTICLKVESGSGWFPTTTVCGGAPGINVAPMTASAFYPSGGWAGAISDFTGGGGDGTRFEMNFKEPGKVWYDADYEFGITSGTIGPSDGRKAPDGRSSLLGEQDPLAKANAAWATGKNRVWGFGKYITPSKDGNRLVNVAMDKSAPQIVLVFFQLMAGLNGYFHPGSVNGVVNKGVGKMLEAAADDHSRKVDGTQAMTITIY